MILRVNILVPINANNPCNNGVVSIDPTHVDIKISQGNSVLASGQLNTIATTSNIIDSRGIKRLITIQTIGEILNCTINFDNVWDYTDIQLEIFANNNGVNFLPYSKLFRIYGYDIGNGNGITGNPDFSIVMCEGNQLYSNTISYREPFSDNILYYFASSCIYNHLELFDELSNKLISNMSKGIYNSKQSVRLCYNVVLGISHCYNNTSPLLPSFNWIPGFSILNNCNTTCINTTSINNIEVHIDYNTIDKVTINDSLYFPFNSFSLHSIIIDSFNNLLLNEVRMDYTDNVNKQSIFSFGNYSIVSDSTYAIKVTFNILDTIDGYIKNGTLEPGYNYIIISDTLDNNFDMLSSIANPGSNATVFNYDTGITPIFGNSILQEVLLTGALKPNAYYKVFSSLGGVDVSNLFPIMYNGANRVFFSDSILQPNNWGSLSGTLPYCLDYSGLILIEAQPIVSECKTLLLDICKTIDIIKEQCNKFIFSNNGQSNATIEMFTFVSGEWVQLNVTPILSGETLDILVIEDGIYRIDIHTVNGIESYLHIVDCKIQECYAKYMDKLICCNTETNCIEISDVCSDKEFYNFNAFSSLIDTYFTLISDIINIDIVYTPQTIIEQSLINTLVDVDKVLNRAMAYCNDCNTPCKNC